MLNNLYRWRLSLNAITCFETNPSNEFGRNLYHHVIWSIQQRQPRALGITKQAALTSFGSQPFQTVLQKWFSCILLAKQMTSEETGAKRGGSKNKCKFLLCEIGWPVLSASQSLLEIRFYLRYDHFSPTPPFMEQYCFPGATHLVTCGVLLKCVESSFWTNQSKIGQISLKVK